jgi:ElaB/YqjD/DUF883 family membrane-anchored ribosome-binding protein
VSIGLAWLMALGRQPAQHQSSLSTSGMRDGVRDMRDKAGGAMQSASETLASAKQRVTGSMDSVRHRASEFTESTKQQWERARGGLDHLVNEQPLVLGAIGLAIGSVLGAAAPRTRAEEQLMGDAARNVAEKAKEVGSQQLDKATQAAKQVAENAMGQKPQPPAGRDKKGAR